MPGEFVQDCQFNKLRAGRTDICLPGLMLEFAADAYPGIDALACLGEIDRLGCLAIDRLAHDCGAREDVATALGEISRLLYRDEGFQGNREEYYDPRNSYLNEVLTRRRGIPISLGVVYMAVANRAGLDVYGVSTPGHFVVGCDHAGETLYVDPFADGDVLDLAACRARIEEAAGQKGCVPEECFSRASPLEIAVRLLRNLKAAYAMVDGWKAMLPVQRRLVMLLPNAADERRDLGLVYLRIGRAQPALDLLNKYLSNCNAEQAQALEPYVRSARRLAAELN